MVRVLRSVVDANQTKVNSITSRKGLYVKTTVLVKRLYIIIFVEEIFDSCVFVVVTSCCFVVVVFLQNNDVHVYETC